MEKGINFEINLTKAKWTPKHVEQIPEIISRSFERTYTREQLEPIVGSDHIHKWPLKGDDDIVTFLKAESKMRECFAEKVIRYKPPRDIIPENWEPKKVKILATGDRLAKFFGEDEVGTSTRKVDTSLKLFECGHFYMKQSLPGSGAYPYQMIFEGRWCRAEKGIHLTYLIRYTGQTSKKADMSISLEALPPGAESSLAWVGDACEAQLNGLVPAIVGEDPYCRVEIYRDADPVGEKKVLTRFNPDAAEPPSWEWTPPDKEELARKEKADKEKVKSEKAEKEKTKINPDPSELKPREFKSRFESPVGAPEAVKPGNSQASSASGGANVAAAKSPAASKSSGPKDWAAGQVVDNEPIWPLVVVGIIFVIILCFFGWLNFGEDIKDLFGIAPDPSAVGATTVDNAKKPEL